jgi:hypothetical protein
MNPPLSVYHPRDPLHEVTLETIVSQLVVHGWAEMGHRIPRTKKRGQANWFREYALSRRLVKKKMIEAISQRMADSSRGGGAA